MTKMYWIDIEQYLPLDQEVWAKDDKGNEFLATPCWYEFKLKDGGFIQSDPYMDGWLIDVSDNWCKEHGKITHWRPKD